MWTNGNTKRDSYSIVEVCISLLCSQLIALILPLSTTLRPFYVPTLSLDTQIPSRIQVSVIERVAEEEVPIFEGGGEGDSEFPKKHMIKKFLLQ